MHRRQHTLKSITTIAALRFVSICSYWDKINISVSQQEFGCNNMGDRVYVFGLKGVCIRVERCVFTWWRVYLFRKGEYSWVDNERNHLPKSKVV